MNRDRFVNFQKVDKSVVFHLQLQYFTFDTASPITQIRGTMLTRVNIVFL